MPIERWRNSCETRSSAFLIDKKLSGDKTQWFWQIRFRMNNLGNLKSYFAHEKALIDEAVTIGSGTRVWAFAHILSGAKIGKDCNICDHTFIEGQVVLGDRVTVKCGVYLWDGVVVENDVFIGPAAVFTNDIRPRSGRHQANYSPTILSEGCSIGANSTILAGNTIGKWSLVGAGSVVTKDVPDFGVVYGNPARLKSWICSCSSAIFIHGADEEECICGKKYILESTGPKILNDNKRLQINRTTEDQ